MSTALNIDMSDILKNPTVSKLNKALIVLLLPKQQIEDSTESQFFCLRESGDPQNTNETDLDPEQITRIFNQMIANSPEFCINKLLRDFTLKNASIYFFEELGKKAEKLIIAFKDRIRIFNKLIQASNNEFSFSNENEVFLKNCIPIILVVENNNKIKLFSQESGEFRAITSLKFGSDIKIIATDTTANRLNLMRYLEKINFAHIQVILFNDLKKARVDKQKPITPYQHSDGIPTLKWIAAKTLALQQIDLIEKKVKSLAIDDDIDNRISEKISDTEKHVKVCGLYIHENCQGVDQLFNDALKYHHSSWPIGKIVSQVSEQSEMRFYSFFSKKSYSSVTKPTSSVLNINHLELLSNSDFSQSYHAVINMVCEHKILWPIFFGIGLQKLDAKLLSIEPKLILALLSGILIGIGSILISEHVSKYQEIGSAPHNHI